MNGTIPSWQLVRALQKREQAEARGARVCSYMLFGLVTGFIYFALIWRW